MRVALGICRHNHMQAVGAVEVVAAVDIMAKEPWFVSAGLLPTIHCVARLSRSTCLHSTSLGMIHAGLLPGPGYLL